MGVGILSVDVRTLTYSSFFHLPFFKRKIPLQRVYWVVVRRSTPLSQGIFQVSQDNDYSSSLTYTPY